MARLGLAIVRGRSMLPTLHDGDRLLVRYGAVPRPGDLVVVRLPADVSGAPRPLAVKRAAREEPAGWWVERDNPAEGVDSWTFGTVAHHDVVAVVTARIWPLRRGDRVPD
jgi:phage repressor protein C with HTH and peptisase S24 domain